jgi:hypothetical protein
MLRVALPTLLTLLFAMIAAPPCLRAAIATAVVAAVHVMFNWYHQSMRGVKGSLLEQAAPPKTSPPARKRRSKPVAAAVSVVALCLTGRIVLSASAERERIFYFPEMFK